MALLTPVSDDDARAVDHLAGIALTIEHAEAGPLAKKLSVRDLDERDLVLRAQSDNEFLVGFFFACLVQDTHVRLTAIEGLGCLAQTAGQTIMDESEFEYTCKAIVVRPMSP